MDIALKRILKFISEPIQCGALKRRLPAERVIAEKLNLSRTTVREKLAVLQALGFVTKSQGSGTYLNRPPSSIFQKDIFEIALKLGHFTIEELEEAREMIEVEVVQAAARNATEDDIRALKYFLDRLLSTRDEHYGHELDVAFHLHLGVATHNAVVVMLLEGLSSVLRKVLTHRRELVNAYPRALEMTDATHTAIFDAVRKKDPNMAAAAMVNHFSTWKDYARKACQYIDPPVL